MKFDEAIKGLHELPEGIEIRDVKDFGKEVRLFKNNDTLYFRHLNGETQERAIEKKQIPDILADGWWNRDYEEVKKVKELSLSDKIIRAMDPVPEAPVLFVSDVREHVVKAKKMINDKTEEMQSKLGKMMQIQTGNQYFFTELGGFFLNEINRNFGDKLI